MGPSCFFKKLFFPKRLVFCLSKNWDPRPTRSPHFRQPFHWTKTYSELCQTSKMEHFVKMFNDWKTLTIFAKRSILDDCDFQEKPLLQMFSCEFYKTFQNSDFAEHRNPSWLHLFEFPDQSLAAIWMEACSFIKMSAQMLSCEFCIISRTHIL